MHIALVNPVTQTVDRPENFWSLFGRVPDTPPLTDAEANYVKLAQAIADLGHKVSLFISDCFTPRQFYTPRGLLVIKYLPTSGKFLFPPAYMPFLPTLYGELKRGQFDVIQTSDLLYPSTLIGALVSRRLFVWEEIDQYLSRRPTRFLQKCHHRTLEKWLQKRVIVIPRSQASQQFLKNRRWKKMAAVIPTPVDTQLFKPIPDLPEGHLLVVSRIAPDRGLSFLLDVMQKLANTKSNIKLKVVGQGSYTDFFQKEIVRRHLSNHIEIHSHFQTHRELNILYNKSYMTLITTEGGLYPYVASESMACGRPVISRFKRGLKDLIQNGKTGYLVDSADEMTERILFLLRNSSARRAMGEEARKFVEGYCSLKKVAGCFIDIYKQYSTMD